MEISLIIAFLFFTTLGFFCNNIMKREIEFCDFLKNKAEEGE